MLVTISDNTFVRHGIAFNVEVSIFPDDEGFKLSYVVRYKDGSGNYIDDLPMKTFTDRIAKDATQNIQTLWNNLVTTATTRVKSKFP